MDIYISLILPVYNVEKYLRECIDSLLIQDVDPAVYEIILVDDGSTDRSGAICDRYSGRHENIHTYHKENGGLSDARNFGLEKANGRYILFVDSDDFIQKNVLGRIIHACRRQGEPQVMFLQAKKIYPDGRIKKYDEPMDLCRLRGSREEALNYLSRREMYPASAWSKMVEKEFLDKNHIRFKAGQLSEDYEWTLALLMHASSYGSHNGNYYFYRQNRRGSITDGISEKHFRDLLEIIENMEKIAASETISGQMSEAVLRFAAYVYRILLWNAADYYKKYQFRVKQKKYLLYKRDSKDMKMIRSAVRWAGLGGSVRLLQLYGKAR